MTFIDASPTQPAKSKARPNISILECRMKYMHYYLHVVAPFIYVILTNTL